MKFPLIPGISALSCRHFFSSSIDLFAICLMYMSQLVMKGFENEIFIPKLWRNGVGISITALTKLFQEVLSKDMLGIEVERMVALKTEIVSPVFRSELNAADQTLRICR